MVRWMTLLAVAAVLVMAVGRLSRSQEVQHGWILVLHLKSERDEAWLEATNPMLWPGEDGGPFTTPAGCAFAAMRAQGSWVDEKGHPFAIVERLCVGAVEADKLLAMNKGILR